VTIEEERLAPARTAFTEMGLTNEQQQRLLDLHVSAWQEMDAARATQTLQAQHDAFAAMRKGWRDESMAAPDTGGSGYQTNINSAMSALHRVLPISVQRQAFDKDGRVVTITAYPRREFDEALLSTGMTDHPAFLRFGMALARVLNESSKTVAPNSPGPPADGGGKAPGRAGLQYDFDRNRRG
jgi:hypothetical protein